MSSNDDETPLKNDAARTTEDPTTEQGLKLFEGLCISSSPSKTQQGPWSDDLGSHDLTTTLRSELAALEYKRGRLLAELEETKSRSRYREQKLAELQLEADQLREQAARQNAVITSLKKRVQELEERERNLYAVQNRAEGTIDALQRDLKYQEEKQRTNEKKIRQLEHTVEEETQSKDRIRSSFQEFTRRLTHILNVDYDDYRDTSPHRLSEVLVRKTEDLLQEVGQLRAKCTNVEGQSLSLEVELRSCKDTVERIFNEKEQLQRQLSAQALELDRARQEKECLEMQYKLAERELTDLREKLVCAKRNMSNATENMSTQESLIAQLRGDAKSREEKFQRLQNEYRHFLESIASLLTGGPGSGPGSGPARFLEARENDIKERIREILSEKKDQSIKIDQLRENLNSAHECASRQTEMLESSMGKLRTLEEERATLHGRIRKLEAELTDCRLAKDSARLEKETLMSFMDRLGKAMRMEQVPRDLELELQMESLLVRSEQLVRFETDKLADKTSVVYQLQRRVRTLREQLQRRDLHLDLLRRKLSLQEDHVRNKSLIQSERDEAILRAKKLSKQLDRFQTQLAEEKARNRELSNQLTEAADYKITALERARKIEELQKRLVESELLRTRCNRKVTLLKEQIRASAENAEQERSISEHSLQLLRDELAQLKQTISDITRRESQLQNFRVSVLKLLSEPICTPDYEIILRLQKMVAAHRDLTMLSRRYEEPLDVSPSRCTSVHPTASIHPPRSPGSRCTRYEDSGFVDPPDLQDIDEEYNKRPVRSSLLP